MTTTVAAVVLVLAPATAAQGASTRGALPAAFGFRPTAQFVEATSFSPGAQTQAVTVQLGPAAIWTGDLLVAWVGEFDAPGQVVVSDNVDGRWSRGPSETFANGLGDIALYYARPLFAPRGMTVTVSAPGGPAFISGTVAHYRGILYGQLSAASVAELPASAQSTDADSGPTAAVGGQDLLFGGLITGGLPSSVVPGSSQGRPLAPRSTDDSGSAFSADVLATAPGAQHAEFTLGAPTDWYAVAAVFRPSL